MAKRRTRTDLYARRTGLSNEQPPFDLQARALYPNDVTYKTVFIWFYPYTYVYKAKDTEYVPESCKRQQPKNKQKNAGIILLSGIR